VVCDDKLGIATELEADMQSVIDSYRCEWKTAIEDAVTLRRFRHFVNSEATDEGIVFVRDRGQIRPASRAERPQAS
jgi:nitrite reductase (NADH) large subunit